MKYLDEALSNSRAILLFRISIVLYLSVLKCSIGVMHYNICIKYIGNNWEFISLLNKTQNYHNSI